MIDELDHLICKAKQRKLLAEHDGISADLIQPELSYLTEIECARVHELKLALPSFAQESLDAKARNRKRRGLHVNSN